MHGNNAAADVKAPCGKAVLVPSCDSEYIDASSTSRFERGNSILAVKLGETVAVDDAVA